MQQRCLAGCTEQHQPPDTRNHSTLTLSNREARRDLKRLNSQHSAEPDPLMWIVGLSAIVHLALFLVVIPEVYADTRDQRPTAPPVGEVERAEVFKVSVQVAKARDAEPVPAEPKVEPKPAPPPVVAKVELPPQVEIVKPPKADKPPKPDVVETVKAPPRVAPPKTVARRKRVRPTKRKARRVKPVAVVADAQAPAGPSAATRAPSKSLAAAEGVDFGKSVEATPAGVATKPATPVKVAAANTVRPARKGAKTGVDNGALLGGYLRGVGAKLRKSAKRRMPKSLRRRASTGRVVVAFKIDDALNIIDAWVKKSSGDGRLDAVAIKTVKQLRKLPPTPSGLVLKGRTLSVPIRFT